MDRIKCSSKAPLVILHKYFLKFSYFMIELWVLDVQNYVLYRLPWCFLLKNTLLYKQTLSKCITHPFAVDKNLLWCVIETVEILEEYLFTYLVYEYFPEIVLFAISYLASGLIYVPFCAPRRHSSRMCGLWRFLVSSSGN